MQSIADKISIPLLAIICSTSSALLILILGKLWDIYFSKVSFKRDYYKQIIGKRLDALNLLYENIADVTHEHSDTGQRFFSFFLNEEQYLARYQLYKKAVSKHFWYSNSTEKALQEYLSITVYQLQIEIKINKNFSHMHYGLANHNDILDKYQKLMASINDDLMSLYKVDKFLKSNKWVK